MYARWFDVKRNAFLGDFSERQTGKVVARHLLGLQQQHEEPSYYSENHGRIIDLVAFTKFVEDHLPLDNGVNPHVKKNKNNFERIANGFDLWDYNNDESDKMRNKLVNTYGAFFSNLQGAERANKEQNLASLNTQGEQNKSI